MGPSHFSALEGVTLERPPGKTLSALDSAALHACGCALRAVASGSAKRHRQRLSCRAIDSAAPNSFEYRRHHRTPSARRHVQRHGFRASEWVAFCVLHDNHTRALSETASALVSAKFGGRFDVLAAIFTARTSWPPLFCFATYAQKLAGFKTQRSTYILKRAALTVDCSSVHLCCVC